jgi:lipid-A-disaccharide synthase
MVNLIAGGRVVPELIQSEFKAANIVRQIEPLLPDGALRQSMMKELKRIRGLLGSRTEVHGGENGAIDRVAAITLERLGMSFPLKESVQL